jgi:ubiquinone/menaquinone biosynthesis C-methylase UbiE
MNIIEKTRTPAEVYDALFVPALFRQWGPIVAGTAGIQRGDHVLDVACGTGVLTQAALERVGPRGTATGLDANPDMLSVARLKPGHIEWRQGKAEALPFPDAKFDAVVSQFGLMFFEDRPAALSEMMRVLKPCGRLAVAVCDAVENSPGYSALAQLLQDSFGDKVADAFRAPFVLGDAQRLIAICDAAGITNAKVTRYRGSVRFASITSLVSTERACVWTLGGMLDDEQFAELLKAAETALKPFAGKNGAVEFEMPALIITAVKR